MPEQLSHHLSVQDTGDDSAHITLEEGRTVPSSNGALPHPSGNGRATPHKKRQPGQDATTSSEKKTRKGSSDASAAPATQSKTRRKKKTADNPPATEPTSQEEKPAAPTPASTDAVKKSATRKRSSTTRKKKPAPATTAQPVSAPPLSEDASLPAAPPETAAHPEEAASADFEPELDATPIKPRREPPQAWQRAALFAFSDEDLAPEVDMDFLEETARRPSIAMSPGQMPPAELLPAPTEPVSSPEQVTPADDASRSPDEMTLESGSAANAAALAPDEIEQESAPPAIIVSDSAPESIIAAPEGIAEEASVLPASVPDMPPVSLETLVMPDTPAAPEIGEEQAILATPFSEQEELEAIPETPMPTDIEQSTLLPETPLNEFDTLEKIPETPLLIPEIEQEWDMVTDAVVEGLPATSITAPPPFSSVEAPPAIERKPTRPEKVRRPLPLPVPARRAPGAIMALLLLAVFLTSSFLLWHDVQDTHLFLSTIDPANGQIASQQDLGGGYQSATAITNPVLSQTALFFGVSGPGVDSQQLFTLANDGGSWRVASQLATPLASATLRITPDNLLAIENTSGLQVMTPAGRLLWQVPGEVPMLGEHAFQPAADSSTIYTVKAAHLGQVVAYDQQSGSPRWTQELNDTLLYSAPFLISGSALYIAADHTIYALNPENGGILWQTPFTARTLLITSGNAPLLIAAGANGLAAFDPTSGKQTWFFKARPDQLSGGALLTPTQLYQAALSGTDNTVYTTGIAWDTGQGREQSWLFAVDAFTGKARWSARVGSGFASADAARVSTPQIDATQGIVLLEQVGADGAPVLSAFDTRAGSLRWSQPLARGTGVLPAFALNANDTISVISLQASPWTTLLSWSWVRTLLFAISLLAGLSLLLLWLLPLPPGGTHAQRILHRLVRVLLLPFKLGSRLWRFSRVIFALVVLAMLIGAGILNVTQQLQPHLFLNALALPGGSTQWQQVNDTAKSLERADGHGSLLITGAGNHLQQLTALDSSGAASWSAFSTEGTLSLPTLAIPPGTLLVAMSGQSTLDYRFAPDDPAYAHPLEHLFSLALLDRASGRVLWKNVIVRAGEAQETSVLTADSRYIYLASRSIAQGTQPAVVQLIAVDIRTGSIAWRIFGPRETETVAPDWGFLLPHGRLLYWQIAGNIYALDTGTGQIQWRRAPDEINPAAMLPEESHMAIGAGVLLVQHSDLYHALDLATGREHWSLPGLGNDTSGAASGVVVNGNTFILYGNGAIEAIDAATQATLWKEDNFASVQDVTVSSDGSLIYALEISSVDGTNSTQSLVALDARNNTVRWTFQPSAHALFIYPGSEHLHYAHGSLFVTICLPGNQIACDRQTLYQVNAQTGNVDWKFEASAIDHVRVSQAGDFVAFQTQSTGWDNFKRIFTR